MKDYQSKNIINIALAGHASSGKTTISETILFNNKVIHKRGSIDAGTTVSDYRDQEKNVCFRFFSLKRQFTIFLNDEVELFSATILTFIAAKITRYV